MGTVADGGVGMPGRMQLANFSASKGLLWNDDSRFRVGFFSASSLNDCRRRISESTAF